MGKAQGWPSLGFVCEFDNVVRARQ